MPRYHGCNQFVWDMIHPHAAGTGRDVATEANFVAFDKPGSTWSRQRLQPLHNCVTERFILVTEDTLMRFTTALLASQPRRWIGVSHVFHKWRKSAIVTHRTGRTWMMCWVAARRKVGYWTNRNGKLGMKEIVDVIRLLALRQRTTSYQDVCWFYAGIDGRKYAVS